MEKIKSIRQAQKERLLMREILDIFMQLTHDEPLLGDLSITRVQLSADGAVCFVFLFTTLDQSEFLKRLDILKLYKPSMRTTLAQRINARYTPNLMFKFDALFEKQQRIESIIESISKED